jgi:hypothetical protein
VGVPLQRHIEPRLIHFPKNGGRSKISKEGANARRGAEVAALGGSNAVHANTHDFAR